GPPSGCRLRGAAPGGATSGLDGREGSLGFCQTHFGRARAGEGGRGPAAGSLKKPCGPWSSPKNVGKNTRLMRRADACILQASACLISVEAAPRCKNEYTFELGFEPAQYLGYDGVGELLSLSGRRSSRLE